MRMLHPPTLRLRRDRKMRAVISLNFSAAAESIAESGDRIPDSSEHLRGRGGLLSCAKAESGPQPCESSLQMAAEQDRGGALSSLFRQLQIISSQNIVQQRLVDLR